MPNIREIFLSIQGEGPYVGHRQLFIRFCDCNLKCGYCDTDFSVKDCQIEYKPGSGEFEYLRNPIEEHILLEIISEFKNYHSISLTGGEPLLSCDFLLTCRPQINAKIYLETNGTLPNNLKKVIKLVDIISMDIKLPSSTGLKSYYAEHYEFIDIALKNKKEIFAKAVVSNKITNSEMDYLKQIAQKIPLIIQPITTTNKALVITKEKLFRISDKIPSARIIPQTHNFMGIL
ncbi:MAG: 7-carboxy-7-deazaguanine synthase QueE [bacterium]